MFQINIHFVLQAITSKTDRDTTLQTNAMETTLPETPKCIENSISKPTADLTNHNGSSATINAHAIGEEAVADMDTSRCARSKRARAFSCIPPGTNLVELIENWDIFCLLADCLSLTSCVALRCATRCYNEFSFVELFGDRLRQSTEIPWTNGGQSYTIVLQLIPCMQNRIPVWQMSIDVNFKKADSSETERIYHLDACLGSFSKVGTSIWNSSSILNEEVLKYISTECAQNPDSHTFSIYQANGRFPMKWMYSLFQDLANVDSDEFFANCNAIKGHLTQLTCSKHPRTKYLEGSNIWLCMQETPTWGPYAKNVRFFLKSDANSLNVTHTTVTLNWSDSIKQSRRKTLKDLGLIISKCSISTKMKLILCSFGVERVLKYTTDDLKSQVLIKVQEFKNFMQIYERKLSINRYDRQYEFEQEYQLWSNFEKYDIWSVN